MPPPPTLWLLLKRLSKFNIMENQKVSYKIVCFLLYVSVAKLLQSRLGEKNNVSFYNIYKNFTGSIHRANINL